MNKDDFKLGPRVDPRQWGKRGDRDWIWMDDLRWGKWMLAKILELW